MIDPPDAPSGGPSGAEAPAGSAAVRRRGRRRRSGGGRQRRSFVRELPVLLLVALLLALVLKTFVVQAFYIPSGSMERTLHGCDGCGGDRVLVNKLVYRLRSPHRGEIVVFNGVDSWTPEVPPDRSGNPVVRGLRSLAAAIGLTPSGEEDFIKRVVGVPGDRVACCDAAGRVTVNGVALTEPYVYQDDHRRFSTVVPPGRLWVMGDHRANSADSRSHTFDPGGGTIPENRVLGQAFLIIWPPSRIRTLPVPSTFHRSGLAHGGGQPAVHSGPAPGLGDGARYASTRAVS